MPQQMRVLAFGKSGTTLMESEMAFLLLSSRPCTALEGSSLRLSGMTRTSPGRLVPSDDLRVSLLLDGAGRPTAGADKGLPMQRIRSTCLELQQCAWALILLRGGLYCRL